MRKDIEEACAAGAPRGSIAEQVLHGLEHHVAACGLQAIVGSWEEAQRAKVGGKDCVKCPALGRNPNLFFSRMAKVFEAHHSGATISRVSPSSRPSNMKGWVSQGTKVSTLKYSALAAQVSSFSIDCCCAVVKAAGSLTFLRMFVAHGVWAALVVVRGGRVCGQGLLACRYRARPRRCRLCACDGAARCWALRRYYDPTRHAFRSRVLTIIWLGPQLVVSR